MGSILIDTEHMLAQGRMDLPVSLCFAAMRGDDLLLNQLLRRGLDPNDLDNNGRTALVCTLLYFSAIYICMHIHIWEMLT